RARIKRGRGDHGCVRSQCPRRSAFGWKLSDLRHPHFDREPPPALDFGFRTGVFAIFLRPDTQLAFMGKPTGFTEYLRELPVDRKASARIRDWLEFHEHMDDKKLQEQAARCMD